LLAAGACGVISTMVTETWEPAQASVFSAVSLFGNALVFGMRVDIRSLHVYVCVF
jgi:hypothetical protein